jgi:hypothetical protein
MGMNAGQWKQTLNSNYSCEIYETDGENTWTNHEEIKTY